MSFFNFSEKSLFCEIQFRRCVPQLWRHLLVSPLLSNKVVALIKINTVQRHHVCFFYMYSSRFCECQKSLSSTFLSVCKNVLTFDFFQTFHLLGNLRGNTFGKFLAKRYGNNIVYCGLALKPAANPTIYPLARSLCSHRISLILLAAPLTRFARGKS